MKIRNFLLTVALAFSTTPVFAAFTYEVIKTGYGDWHNPQDFDHMQSYYKIRITEGRGDIYLSEWMDSFNSTKQVDALTEKGVAQYGYHVLNTDEQKIWTISEEVNNPDHYISIEDYTSPNSNETMVRHGYYLGTFSAGQEIDIYMKNLSGGSAWSNSSRDMGGYLTGNTVDEVALAKMGYYTDGSPTKGDYNTKLAAMALMPLAELDTGNNVRAYFGIYGKESFGSPLPTPVVTLLIALGFGAAFVMYRNRKQVKA